MKLPAEELSNIWIHYINIYVHICLYVNISACENTPTYGNEGV